MTTILVLGATGLVGAQVLRQALARSEVTKVVAPARRTLPSGLPGAAEGGKAGRPGGGRLDNPIVDFERLPEDAAWWRADAAICALGTTIRQAGSQAAFRRVDHDYVLAAARLARLAGTPVFALNSSLAADPASKNFYLRVKGETERDLAALGFDSLTIVRPSLLDGGPRPELRPGELMGLFVTRLLGPLIPRRYRPVPTRLVAQAMLDACLRADPGVRVIESGQLLEPG